MSITSAEIQTQPKLWRRAGALARDVAALLPAAGERVCAIGCGTSLYVAQAWAALREGSGHGETDAFAPSEIPNGRRYDALVAVSRSGFTSEVLHALRRGLADRSVAITASRETPVSEVADDTVELAFADERSVVLTDSELEALASATA